MLNILVALNIWNKLWKKCFVRIHVDNSVVLEICNSGYTRVSTLVGITRSIWLVTSLYDIELSITHIAGSKNCTADLFRWVDSDDKK